MFTKKHRKISIALYVIVIEISKKKTRKMINKNAPLIYLPLRAPEFLFSVIVVRLIYANETKEKTKNNV